MLPAGLVVTVVVLLRSSRGTHDGWYQQNKKNEGRDIFHGILPILKWILNNDIIIASISINKTSEYLSIRVMSA